MQALASALLMTEIFMRLRNLHLLFTNIFCITFSPSSQTFWDCFVISKFHFLGITADKDTLESIDSYFMGHKINMHDGNCS